MKVLKTGLVLILVSVVLATGVVGAILIDQQAEAGNRQAQMVRTFFL